MNTKKAGRIEGDPVCGLCYREVIEVTKVYDGCKARFDDMNFILDVSEPVTEAAPFRFVRAYSNGETLISNLNISEREPPENTRRRQRRRVQRRETRQSADAAARGNEEQQISSLTQGRGLHKACISFDCDIPIVVEFRCDEGGTHRVYSTVPLHRDVKLYLPPEALTPFEIKVKSSLVCSSGSFLNTDQVSLHCCIMQIIKVTGVVDLLVPSYGYCEYPTCCGSGRFCGEIIDEELLFPPLL